MYAPITVNYVPDGEDWTVTVTDEQQTESATASGLIAARDQADQIVEKMVPSQTSRTVVHLLEGDAVAFTNTYLQVRLGLTAPGTGSISGSGSIPSGTGSATIPTPGTGTIPAPAEAATVPAAATAEPSPQQTQTPTPSAEPPAAETSAPTNPEQPTSSDKEPEMVNVPAQSAEQVS